MRRWLFGIVINSLQWMIWALMRLQQWLLARYLVGFRCGNPACVVCNRPQG